MLNTVSLQGRLAADPELRQTNSGLQVARFRIAVNRGTKDANGNSLADFISCVAWKGTAELVAKWFHKGDMILVSGRLQSSKYQDKDGNNRTAIEVVTGSVYFCETGRQRAGNAQNTPPAAAAAPADGFEPITDIDDGDLPF